MEEVVLQAIIKLFDNQEAIEKFADKIIQVNEQRLKDQSIMNLLIEEQEKISKAKQNIISAIEQGIITPTTKERLEELENKQNEIAEKMIIEKSKNKLTLERNDIVSYFRKTIQNKGERLIDLLIKQIVLYDDKVIIKCNYSARKTDNTDLNISLNKTKTKIETHKTFNATEMKNIEVEIKA